jgi:hypothetical protein
MPVRTQTHLSEQGRRSVLGASRSPAGGPHGLAAPAAALLRGGASGMRLKSTSFNPIGLHVIETQNCVSKAEAKVLGKTSK